MPLFTWTSSITQGELFMRVAWVIFLKSHATTSGESIERTVRPCVVLIEGISVFVAVVRGVL